MASSISSLRSFELRAATSLYPPVLLAQRRGEVSQDEEGRVNFFGQFAVHFGFVADTLPLRVVLEGFPVRGCLFTAGMLEDVDQGVALLWFVDRRPVSDAFDSMPVKKLYGVVAEARQQFS
jgi:hypothetical protein